LPGAAPDLEYRRPGADTGKLTSLVDQHVRVPGTVPVIVLGDVVENGAVSAGVGSSGHGGKVDTTADGLLMDGRGCGGGVPARRCAPPPRRTCRAMPDAWVYLLRCRDESLYTGWTVDLERRLARHRSGAASRYTASRLPVELALAIPMPNRTAARREEARIKRLPRPAKLALLSAAARTSA
jgi:putative endonuclease